LAEGVDGRKIRSIVFGPFSIQPIILLIFVLTFLLLEWLLSENAVVGNLVGQFWSIPRQNSTSLETVTTNLLCWHDEGENHGVNKTRRLQHTGEEFSSPPRMFSCIAPARDPRDVRSPGGSSLWL
jgi:hypothetical protein